MVAVPRTSQRSGQDLGPIRDSTVPQSWQYWEVVASLSSEGAWEENDYRNSERVIAWRQPCESSYGLGWRGAFNPDDSIGGKPGKQIPQTRSSPTYKMPSSSSHCLSPPEARGQGSLSRFLVQVRVPGHRTRWGRMETGSGEANSHLMSISPFLPSLLYRQVKMPKMRTFSRDTWNDWIIKSLNNQERLIICVKEALPKSRPKATSVFGRKNKVLEVSTINLNLTLRFEIT